MADLGKEGVLNLGCFEAELLGEIGMLSMIGCGEHDFGEIPRAERTGLHQF